MAGTRDSIRIPNLKQIQDSLVELGVSTKEMSAASQKAGDITAQAIRGLMTPHVRTGKLRSTVRAKKQARKVVVTVGNNTTAKYAGLQNFGSKRKHVTGQYFVQMGIRRTRQYVLDTYIVELQKLVNKAERKANG
jgi:HK97 gp10 family phage protein